MRKSRIINVLGGVFLAGSMALGQEYAPSAQQIPSQNLETRAQLTQADINFRGVINELLIYDVVKSHLTMSTPTSIYLKQIEDELEFRFRGDKEGAEKKIIESFSYPHRLCLALAMRHGESEVSEQEYESLGKKIIGLEQTMSSLAKESYVDYLDTRVYNASIKWGKLKTHEFQKLFLANKVITQGNLDSKQNRIDFLKRLYNTAFTSKEYARWVQEEDTVTLEIEKALLSTARRGPIHQSTIKNEIHEINESAKQIRYGIFYGYFENKPTLPHQIR